MYATVNGLRMYYEVHGRGDPLLLLHGGVSTIETSFSKILSVLAENHQVIAAEQQGHGRTADLDRPLSYEQMADDTAALLRHLDPTSADVLGYSNGAGLGLQLAVDHPALVRKLVMITPAYHLGGFHPGFMDGLADLTAAALDGTIYQQAYAKIAPRPQDWPAFVQKTKIMDQAFTGWTAEQVRAIAAPALVVVGDSDIVTPEHAVELFRLFGGGASGDEVGLPPSQLAILPGTTHLSIMDRAAWLVPIVEEFLAVSPVK
ncbi:alpha/beta hydrolase [Fodinicola feengrottensis]|uniref:Alpha/beta hydrolase n=3 Tax=Fodinicola feengrottensis TaxID=435914 RepID=A0ABP4T6F5_9ACTN